MGFGYPFWPGMQENLRKTSVSAREARRECWGVRVPLLDQNARDPGQQAGKESVIKTEKESQQKNFLAGSQISRAEGVCNKSWRKSQQKNWRGLAASRKCQQKAYWPESVHFVPIQPAGQFFFQTPYCKGGASPGRVLPIQAAPWTGEGEEECSRILHSPTPTASGSQPGASRSILGDSGGYWTSGHQAP